jgi:hypothetical protein
VLAALAERRAPPVPIQRLPPSWRSRCSRSRSSKRRRSSSMSRLSRNARSASRQAARILEPAEQLLGEGERLEADVLEVGEEGDVEGVELADLLDADRARDPVEAVQAGVVQPLVERLHQREPLVRAHVDPALAQLEEEVDQHRLWV